MTASITIGMPVFNEERFLRDSIESILAQSHQNIELIISDNGSSDNTEQICREYEKKCSWLKYHRFNKNGGPAQNFKYVIENASGQYFMWACGHDLWAENYLEECVTALESNPNAVVAFGLCNWIDAKGRLVDIQTGISDTRGLSVIDRFFTVFLGNMNPILSVMRITGIGKIKVFNIVGTDLVILCNLALIGDFILASDTSWYRRDFRYEQKYTDKLNRYKSNEYRLSKGFLSRYFPLARLPIEIVKQVLYSKIYIVEKMLILAVLIIIFPVKYITGKYLA